MTTQEQENFYRHSTVIVDETKDSFLHLLDFHLTNQGITLQRFIEINGHFIYHMCFNRYPCCQCPPGTRAETRGSRVLHPPQLEILFDKTSSKLSGHYHGSKSAPHCCCPVNPNLQLQDLDFTLARLLLVNFTTLVLQGSPERIALDDLVSSRNHSFAHAKEGKISNSEYQKSMADIENSLLVLAKVYGKEIETKQRLNYIAKQPLNSTICLQYHNTLLQQCQIDETIKQLLGEKKLPEFLTRDLEDIRVLEGNDGRFEFWTKERNIIAEWFTEDNRIEVSDKFGIETSGVKHTLVVRNADLTDRGIYTAKFEGSERSARLDIDEYFTKNIKRTYEYVEGDMAELSCAVLEDNVTAHWEKDGVSVQQLDRYLITDEGKTHKLTIQHIILNDAGNFCVKICDRMRSTSLQVKEYFTKPLDTITCIEGETVQIECEVLDDNQAALWFKDGTEVSTSDKYKAERHGRLHRLIVINTKLEDNGEYSVKIKHCVRHSQLIVQEMPTVIRNLSEQDKELYMDIIRSGTETRYFIRIVIIGENGVGKTCLLRRLLKQSMTGVQSTDGIDIHRCRIRLKDGKWIFNEVSDKKKELLTRIKMARHTSTVEEEPLQETADSLGASGLQDDYGSENSTRESPETSQNSSVRAKKKRPGIVEYIKTKFNRKTRKDLTSTAITNLAEVSELKMKNLSQPKPNNTVTRVLTEKVLQGLDDLLNGIEEVEVPDDKFVECGILDFAGEKEYYATHPIFLNPNALHLLVANIMKDVKPITNEDGFDKIGGLSLFT